MTLLHLTDLHLFADPARSLMGWVTEDSFEAVLEAALGDGQPDAVLLTGDLAQDGHAATYARLAQRLRVLGVPCLWLPGNHDHAPTMATAFAPFPWMRRSCLDLPARPGDAQDCAEPVPGRLSERRPGWRLIAVDTSTPEGDHGRLTVPELQRLDAALRAARHVPTLVALHHPPVGLGSAWLDDIGLWDAAAFWRVVDRHPQVRAVAFGHVHQELDTVRSSALGHRARVLSTPASCFQFVPGTENFALDSRPPAYRWIYLGAHPTDGGVPGDERTGGPETSAPPTLDTTVCRVAVTSSCLPTAAGY